MLAFDALYPVFWNWLFVFFLTLGAESILVLRPFILRGWLSKSRAVLVFHPLLESCAVFLFAFKSVFNGGGKKNILSLHVPDISIVAIVYAVRMEKMLEGEILSLSASSSLSLGGKFFLRLFADIASAVFFLIDMGVCNPMYVWSFGSSCMFLWGHLLTSDDRHWVEWMYSCSLKLMSCVLHFGNFCTRVPENQTSLSGIAIVRVVVYPLSASAAYTVAWRNLDLVAATYDWSVEVRDSRVIQCSVQKITASRLQWEMCLSSMRRTFSSSIGLTWSVKCLSQSLNRSEFLNTLNGIIR